MRNESGSITHWIHEIQDGNRDAAQQLWAKYFARLVALARNELKTTSRRVADEEDVALSAFETFYRTAEQGKYPDLADRDSLWRLLVRITANKVVDQKRKQGRQRRGGGQVRGESAFKNQYGESFDALAQVVGDEPTPEFATAMREQFERLLSILDDDELKEMAIAKMEGYSVKEIAERTNRSIRTVERRLQLVRAKLQAEITI